MKTQNHSESTTTTLLTKVARISQRNKTLYQSPRNDSTVARRSAYYSDLSSKEIINHPIFPSVLFGVIIVFPCVLETKSNAPFESISLFIVIIELLLVRKALERDHISFLFNPTADSALIKGGFI